MLCQFLGAVVFTIFSVWLIAQPDVMAESGGYGGLIVWVGILGIGVTAFASLLPAILVFGSRFVAEGKALTTAQLIQLGLGILFFPLLPVAVVEVLLIWRGRSIARRSVRESAGMPESLEGRA